jgi:hypothetical protein
MSPVNSTIAPMRSVFSSSPRFAAAGQRQDGGQHRDLQEMIAHKTYFRGAVNRASFAEERVLVNQSTPKAMKRLLPLIVGKCHSSSVLMSRLLAVGGFR